MVNVVLVAYASKHGSTAEVAATVAETLRKEGFEVALEPVGKVRDLTGYRAVVLGCALYTGRPHPEARQFLARRREALSRLPLAVFAMGPRTLGAEDVGSSRAQLERALRRLPELDPVATAVFGGVVDPATLRFPFNRMPASDARDWDEIERWAGEVARTLSAAPVAVPT